MNADKARRAFKAGKVVVGRDGADRVLGKYNRQDYDDSGDGAITGFDISKGGMGEARVDVYFMAAEVRKAKPHEVLLYNLLVDRGAVAD